MSEGAILEAFEPPNALFPTLYLFSCLASLSRRARVTLIAGSWPERNLFPLYQSSDRPARDAHLRDADDRVPGA